MKKLIACLAVAVSLPAAAQVAVGELAADAPDRYTVVRGDTLWDISARFLRSPWKWPKLWAMNKDHIRDPHWIYPGDVIVITRSDTEAVATLERGPIGARATLPGTLTPTVRDEGPSVAPITSIPVEIIRSFLSRPLVVEPNGHISGPRVVAVPENRMYVGTGATIYVGSADYSERSRFAIYRPGPMLKDPDTGKELAREVVFVGIAALVTPGTPATFTVLSARQEVGVGDYLQPIPIEPIFSIAPTAPSVDIKGKVIALQDARGSSSVFPNGDPQTRPFDREGGRLATIIINRGTADGVREGDVLALERPGQVVQARNNMGYYLGRKVDPPEVMPNINYGAALVFKAFERVSFALVVQADLPVSQGDLALSPDDAARKAIKDRRQ